MDVQDCVKTIQGSYLKWLRGVVLPSEKVACIVKLAEHRDKYCDGVILTATLDHAPSVRDVAVGVITARFHELNSIKAVETHFRDVSIEPNGPALWQESRAVDEVVALISLASINWSGYIRQAALVQMAKQPDPRYVPFILRRLGDWVPQVRDQASKTLSEYYTSDLRTGFLNAIADLDALARVKRIDLKALYQSTMRWLVEDVPQAKLLQDVQDLSDAARNRMVRYMLSEHTCEEAVLRAFMKDHNFIIRISTVRHLRTRTEEWTNAMLIEALSSTSGMERSVAFKELLERDRITEPVLRNGLADTVFDIRRLSADRLGMSRAALLEHYRALLSSDAGTVGGLLGLGDLKALEAVAEVVPFTEHPVEAVRRAALMALSQLAPDVAYDRAMLLIVDPKKRIRAKAAAILLDKHDQAVVERARELLTSEQVQHKLVGLSLLNGYGGWQVLGDMLLACLDTSPRVVDQAWVNLESWISYARRLFTTPAHQDLERARVALDQLNTAETAPNFQQKGILVAVKDLLT